MPLYDFALSLQNQMTPTLRVGSEMVSYLAYIETDDGFTLNQDGTVECIVPELAALITIKQLTTNLEVVSVEGESDRIIEKTN